MPYLGSTVFVGALMVAILASLAGFFLLARALSPRFVDRAERAAAERPLACALVGFPLGLAGLAVSGALAGAAPGPARAGGLLLFALVAGFILAGVAGVAQRVGAALGTNGPPSSPALRLLRGAVVLELAMVLPVVGWLLVLPLAVAIGSGAACLAAVRAGGRSPVAVPSHGA